ncbi:MAG: DUF3857 domain-containing protein [Flavobacteriaceae bacterium]|nr:DUF3857 domain-containing protein [Flavobacteriaceae bacterium]
MITLRNLLSIGLFFIALQVTSQETNFPKWGIFSDYEKNLTVYEKDSTAHAVVLNEIGYSKTEDGGDYNIVTQVHIRIKILDTEGFEEGNVKIRYHKNEEITKVRATTTNIVNDSRMIDDLDMKNVFYEKISDNYSSVNFTFPNLQKGSILEYSYIKKSPYYLNFGKGWTFQNDIPTLKSTFYALIPGFWHYNIITIGIEKQNIKQNLVVKKCIDVGNATADCLFLELEEIDVPAFIEEDYMNSKYNFLKRVSFELKTFTDAEGISKQYANFWSDTDKKLFGDYEIARQVGEVNFIKKYLPVEYLKEPDELIKAKNVYEYIRKYYHWNGNYEIFNDFNSKKAFESKTGNVAEINSMLINALLAAGIQADLALLSTRENGFANKLSPGLIDFDYAVAHITIKGTHYFLDATNDLTPFGILPFECLNNDIRVFPKKGDSYWFQYVPEKNNATNVTSMIEMSEDGVFSSKNRIMQSGYNALAKRSEILEIGEKNYIDERLSHDDEVEMSNYVIENLAEFNTPLEEKFDLLISGEELNGNRLYIKPFLYYEFEENPFKQKSRQYPVDFGYLRKYNYTVVFMIPNGYTVQELPKSRKFFLPNYAGEMTYLSEAVSDRITIKLTFALNQITFEADEYEYLKSFFAELIKIQNERIILTKTN